MRLRRILGPIWKIGLVFLMLTTPLYLGRIAYHQIYELGDVPEPYFTQIFESPDNLVEKLV